jgi:hypothetical protein
MVAPEWCNYWSCDAAAECLGYKRYLPEDYSGDLYSRLWELKSLAGTPTPLGGDGTGGTVETPDGRLGKYDDTLASVWSLLSDVERAALILAEQNN